MALNNTNLLESVMFVYLFIFRMYTSENRESGNRLTIVIEKIQVELFMCQFAFYYFTCTNLVHAYNNAPRGFIIFLFTEERD